MSQVNISTSTTPGLQYHYIHEYNTTDMAPRSREELLSYGVMDPALREVSRRLPPSDS